MDRENKIRKLAYRFYLKRDKKYNLELKDWLMAEEKIIRQERFKLLRHPLFIIFITGFFVWPLQQQYMKNVEMQKIKFEILKRIPAVHASYYQEIWNQRFAFRDKTPSQEYRRNIQRLVVEATDIEMQLPFLFKDRKIYENWKESLQIFHDANYPISRDGISEQQLNEKLNSATPLINDILNRIYKELKHKYGILGFISKYWEAMVSS